MAHSWPQRSPASGGAQPGSGGAGPRSYSVMAHLSVDGSDIEVCGGAARAAKAKLAPINLLETDEDKGTDNDHEQGTQALGSTSKREKNNMWLKSEMKYPFVEVAAVGPSRSFADSRQEKHPVLQRPLCLPRQDRALQAEARGEVQGKFRE